MSSDLTVSARLARDAAFSDVIRAAMVERAVAQLAAEQTDALAKAVLRDSDYLLPAFVRFAANDATVTKPGWSANDADARRVVAAAWALIRASVPNLGG